MKFIQKTKTSNGYQKLLQLKRDDGTYEDVKNDKSKNNYIRDEVLTSLLEEQNYLCAYCMKKISLSDSSIEHIIGQKYIENGIEIGKKNEINYNNFLAVCDGKSCKDDLHCDKSRANYQKERPLFVSPLENRIMQNIKYSEKGMIYYNSFLESKEVEELKDHIKLDEVSNIRFDLQKVLNLNCDNLKERRKLLISALKRLTKNWSSKEKMQKEYDKYIANPSLEFSQVAIYHLSKKL